MAKERLNWTADSLPEAGAQAGTIRGLSDGEIGVAFQPIVDVRTGSLFANEVLVRCTRPEFQYPPALFERASKEGACGRLGRMIRDVAFQLSNDVALFVNIHPEELSARWLVRPDDPVGFHRHPVFLEITESAAMGYFDVCMSVLRELRVRTNARLVVDDFGAGYSNLDRIIQLEPAVVKLDLAIIRDIHREKRKQIVTRHMVSLCADLGATVVAEGIETIEELRCVRDLGVDYAQGYFLARPANPPPSHVWPLGSKGRGKGGTLRPGRAVDSVPPPSRPFPLGRVRAHAPERKTKPPSR